MPVRADGHVLIYSLGNDLKNALHTVVERLEDSAQRRPRDQLRLFVVGHG